MNSKMPIQSESRSAVAGLTRMVAEAYARFGLKAGSRIGVAFSGGADSLALLASSVECGMQCVALHCNFRLRGEESSRDEQIALRMAQRLGTEVVVKWFDAAEYARSNGVSIEMACRELRYRWFDECRESLGLDAIALGHNAGDNIETFFLNLVRGSGLRGLSGIPARREGFVRPMMEAGREDIMAYLEGIGIAQRNCDYAVDSTNLQPVYARNRVRLQLLPAVEKALPGLLQGVRRSMRNLSRDSELIEELARRHADQLMCPDGAINLTPLLEMRNGAVMLFHILNLDRAGRADYADVERIVEMARRGASGLRFMVDSGREGYLLDRGRLVPIADAGASPESVNIKVGDLVDRGEISFGSWVITAEIVTISLSQIVDKMIEGHKCGSRTDFAVFDLEAIKGEPLEIRSWRAGDFMEPLGMRGRKKLSDIFKDAKIPLDRKGEWPVVCAGGRVIWVAGLRQSRHYGITDARSVAPKLLLRVKPHN